MSVGEADQSANKFYDYLEGRFGPADPRSSGYRSVQTFEFEAAVIRTLLRRHGGQILDVACGHGLITAPLVAEGRRVIGLDYNETAVHSSSRKGLIALRGDAFCMPIQDGSFDVVLSTEFIQQYTPDETRSLIGELSRVARRGGVVIVIWRQSRSPMRRLITTASRTIDLVRRCPPLKLFNHRFATVREWGAQNHLELMESLAVSPLLRLTLQGAEGFFSRLLGTSYVAIFRKLT